jgi:hypothetical protein
VAVVLNWPAADFAGLAGGRHRRHRRGIITEIGVIDGKTVAVRLAEIGETVAIGAIAASGYESEPLP